jgi:hypothetical protein
MPMENTAPAHTVCFRARPLVYFWTLLAIIVVNSAFGCGQSTRAHEFAATPGTAAVPVSVVVAPSSVTLRSGAAQQMTAKVTGAKNGSVIWTAAIGSITSNGLYTAPTVSSDSVDTISATSAADGASYASATVNIQATSTTTSFYSITSQEAITNVPYPNSFVSKPLPSDKMSHLLANSAAIVSTALSDGGNTPASRYGLTYIATPGINDMMGDPIYYATSSDPVYTITSCKEHGTGSRNPVGHSFHLPSGAKFGGNPNGGGCSLGQCTDQMLLVWDQTQNVLFSSYTYGSSNPALPACSGHCYISLSHCGMANRATDSAYGNPGAAYATNGISPEAGLIRTQELIQGQINHALLLNTGCTNGTIVFPNVSPGYTASVCSNKTNRPPSGALVFLDYTPTQLATLKTTLPAWQYPIVAAMSKYGGYISDTGSSLGSRSIEPSRIESGQSFKYYGKTDPMWSFLAAHCGVGCKLGTHSLSPPYSSSVYSLSVFANIPNLPGPSCSSACGVVQHMHIANPCIAKGLAGLSASQGACF